MLTYEEALAHARDADRNSFKRKKSRKQKEEELVKHPQPAWMSDKSLLPKKPPGKK